MSMMSSRGRAYVFLVLALGGIARFSSGLRLVDTIGLLGSGVLAGVALAQIAAGRNRLRAPALRRSAEASAEAEGPRRI